MRIRITALVLVITGCFANNGSTKAPVPDSRLIQGEWRFLSATSAREPNTPEQFANVRFSFMHDKLTIRAADDDPMTLCYTLDSSRTPKHIDTTHEIDPGDPIVQLGIYAIDEDTLKLSIASAGAPRPKTLADESATSLVLERIEEMP